jgi:hypothetical protein
LQLQSTPSETIWFGEALASLVRPAQAYRQPYLQYLGWFAKLAFASFHKEARQVRTVID